MIILISPAKKLDFESAGQTTTHSHPEFLHDSKRLIQILRKKTLAELCKLMNISQNLGELNLARYKSFKTPFDLNNAKQAIFAFKGDVYSGMQAENFSEADTGYAQQHLRILSGLYGLLRPLDCIQPYRLEMGTALDNPQGKDLYHFWGDKLTQSLNDLLVENQPAGIEPIVINLASKEYFSSIKPKKLKAKLINIIFRDKKGDQYKSIYLYTKIARGLMANYLIKNRIQNSAVLKQFNTSGYEYREEVSTEQDLVFYREKQ